VDGKGASHRLSADALDRHILALPCGLAVCGRDTGGRTIRELKTIGQKLSRAQEYAGNVVVLGCIPDEVVKVNHDAIQ
jgi:hypothetical protein